MIQEGMDYTVQTVIESVGEVIKKEATMRSGSLQLDMVTPFQFTYLSVDSL